MNIRSANHDHEALCESGQNTTIEHSTPTHPRKDVVDETKKRLSNIFAVERKGKNALSGNSKAGEMGSDPETGDPETNDVASDYSNSVTNRGKSDPPGRITGNESLGVIVSASCDSSATSKATDCTQRRGTTGKEMDRPGAPSFLEVGEMPWTSALTIPETTEIPLATGATPEILESPPLSNGNTKRNPKAALAPASVLPGEEMPSTRWRRAVSRLFGRCNGHHRNDAFRDDTNVQHRHLPLDDTIDTDDHHPEHDILILDTGRYFKITLDELEDWLSGLTLDRLEGWLKEPKIRTAVFWISFFLAIAGIILAVLSGIGVIRPPNVKEPFFDVSVSNVDTDVCVNDDVIKKCSVKEKAAPDNQNPLRLHVGVWDGSHPVTDLGIGNFMVTANENEPFGICGLSTCGNESFVSGDGFYQFLVNLYSSENWSRGSKSGRVSVTDDNGKMGFSKFHFEIPGLSIAVYTRVTSFLARPAAANNHNPIKLLVLVWDQTNRKPITYLTQDNFVVNATRHPEGGGFDVCEREVCGDSIFGFYYDYVYVILLDRVGKGGNWTEHKDYAGLVTVEAGGTFTSAEIAFQIPLKVQNILELFVRVDTSACARNPDQCTSNENHTEVRASGNNRNPIKLAIIVWHDSHAEPITALTPLAFNVTANKVPPGAADFAICRENVCGPSHFETEEIIYKILIHPSSSSNWTVGGYEGTVHVSASEGASGSAKFSFNLSSSDVRALRTA